jgi:hypothetical protein
MFHIASRELRASAATGNSPAPRWRSVRFLLLAAAAMSLAVGLWSGLALIGVMLPGGTPEIVDRHGALMICGFFGTLISLERAVALARRWAYAAPLLSALGALLLLFGDNALVSAPAFLAASLALTIASASIVLRQPALFTVGLTVAAAAWAMGTLAWLSGRPMAEVTGWWLAFLILTIAAERLELSRVLQPSRIAQAAFTAALALIVIGAALGELSRAFAPFTILGLLGSAVWLLVYDVARRSVRQTGQVRFSAACLLAGYTWLAVAGVELSLPRAASGFIYDAVVHAITIGFVLAMVFGHALIILPAVTGLRARYHPALYAALALLQLSVAIRVLADQLEWFEPRAASGVLTVISLAGFALTVTVASIRDQVPRRQAK